MQKIQRKRTLIFLQLVVVLVFGKILGHGDELVPDVVPAIKRLIGTGASRLRSLILRLGLTVETGSDYGEQSDGK